MNQNNNGIFISYSHEDFETVNKIAGVIKNSCSSKVWFDINLRGGEYYFSVIANHILESQFFVFIVSAKSTESDWCLRELEFAASERKNIVAVWIDNIAIPPRVKLVIQNTHYIYYRSESNEAFSEAMSKAFVINNNNDLPQQKINYALNHEGSYIWNEHYFISTDDKKNIRALLKREKNNKYSECFAPENAYLLGLAYELGINVKVDLKRAEFYYKISAHRGSYEGKYLYAAVRLKQLASKSKSESDSNSDSGELLSEMIDAAEHNSIYALTYLGIDYYYGKNFCERDIAKAYKFWHQAAEAGGIAAMCYMSYGYLHGECVIKDIDLAYMYALIASEHEFPSAYRILASIYEEREGDYDKALEMYGKAVQHGDYFALYFECEIYGRKRDYDKQREFCEKALDSAQAGKIESAMPFYRMGYIYENGEGVEQDIIKAVKYYLKAASRKNEMALNYVVSVITAIQNKTLKEYFLHKAYMLNCSNAAYKLGKLERSSEDAVKFFVKGAENGDIKCVTELLSIFSYVLSRSKDRDVNRRKEAIKWFEFFFAHVDEERFDFPNYYFARYYFAYAVELDYDPNFNLPDREFVKMYFQKSLDKSPSYLYQIVRFVVSGYLFPEESSSGLNLDVKHAEEMLNLLENYLMSYRSYIMNGSEYLKQWTELMKIFQNGYNRIADCYEQGLSVPKNKDKSKYYRKKASSFVQAMI
ncbi:MAG: SEL1-like repeat protein [Synergistaceae bacterium]|nr:SEL1-like repeat protein [Synergistaceae bacterium]